MRNIERANERGSSDLGWLHSRFSYSFAEYMNPKRMGFGALRVVNDDIVDPQSGFPLHHHEQMEIVTVMLSGVLTHEDSMGNKRELKAGEVQAMTAGTGVNHSEWNHGKVEAVKLLQIWMHPKERALIPSYDQKQFSVSGRENTFQILAAGVKKEGALFIHQDAVFARAKLAEGKTVHYVLSDSAHGVFVFVVSGAVTLGDDALGARDSVEISGELDVSISATEDADILVIEVPLRIS